MKNLSKILLIASCLLLPVINAHRGACGTEYPEDIAERLQARYDKIASLSFNFIQNTSGEMTGRPRRGSGKAAFVKLGGKSYMRWDYTSPDKQVLTNDGETFSMYFAKLHQMIVSPANTLDADLTYSFFTGKGVLKRDFYIRPAEEEFQSENSAVIKVIKLIPKTPQSQVQDIHLWVTPDSLIRRINIRDQFGTVTVLNFTDITVDSLVGKPPKELLSFFSFTPPEGTEIIRQ
ncbi:outer membrane lipoprotein carrier protein LolA [Desulfopila sp. IMCC35006]|uniref:LolA family protein n=1 Tax=Desulfopila sp. IMCC35006 TaxID=2569542 RepID=UPI0010ABA054|nr:outer membrane lipoprotein carrier protein LolA [Desulfopila sp. IMCC35006]TKB24152.1 outer membrane lipoprotein carrier protein LolA [Desulfopila sp. IMCC35006]